MKRGLVLVLALAACAPAAAPARIPRASPAATAQPVPSTTSAPASAHLAGASPCAPAPPAPSASAPSACECATPAEAASVESPRLPLPLPLPPDQAAVAMMLREREAANHIATGMEKLRSRDGKACLAELDKHDALDKRPQMLSTRPESSMALSRSLCLMLAGRCPEGRELAKKSFQANRDVGKEQVPAILDAYTSRYCEGALSPRDELIKAWTDLAQKSSMGSPASAECSKSYETVRRLATTVKPRDEDDHMVRGAVAPSLGFVAARCFGRAGDCAAARLAYDDGMAATRPGAPPLPPAAAQSGFDGVVPSCKGR